MADMNKAGTPKQAPIVPGFTPKQHVGVGGEILSAEPIEYNEGRYTAKIVVHNTGDRPIQAGSHFHFFEVNRYLEFDRAKAFIFTPLLGIAFIYFVLTKVLSILLAKLERRLRKSDNR